MAAAACEAPTSARNLTDASTRFYAAWHVLDEVAVEAAMKDADTAVRCIDEPLAAPDVVTYFQMRGLAWFLERDSPKARDAFRAAQGVLPDYALPTTVAKTGDAWYEMYEALRGMPDDARAELPAPAVGWVQVDGARADQRPTARPWVFQQFDGTGAVVKTEVVWTREAPPAYVTGVAEAPPVAVAPVVPESHASRGLAYGGAAAAVAGLAGLVGAGVLRGRYNNAGTKPEEADRLLTPNAALGVLGYTGLAVGAGLGTGAVMVGKW